MMRNYVKIEKKSLLYNYYAYIDTADFLADSIFMQEKLRVFFGKTGRKQDSQYVVVLCKVWKWDAEKFVRAIEKTTVSEMQIVLGRALFSSLVIGIITLLKDPKLFKIKLKDMQSGEESELAFDELSAFLKNK